MEKDLIANPFDFSDSYYTKLFISSPTDFRQISPISNHRAYALMKRRV